MTLVSSDGDSGVCVWAQFANHGCQAGAVSVSPLRYFDFPHHDLDVFWYSDISNCWLWHITDINNCGPDRVGAVLTTSQYIQMHEDPVEKSCYTPQGTQLRGLMGSIRHLSSCHSALSVVSNPLRLLRWSNTTPVCRAKEALSTQCNRANTFR